MAPLNKQPSPHKKPTSQSQPTLEQPQVHTLSNGIPVLLQDFEGDVAATYWWVRSGSCDEDPSEAGFAHFLEHMLFKDAAAKESGKSSTGQIARAVESLGGDINAYTSFDQTVYHVTCAATHWPKVIDEFGTMAKPQKFLKSDFEREREVILEELKKNEDSPSRQLFQELFTLTFAKHPYGKPVIGFKRTLNGARVQKLEAFYRRAYASSRMGLILVGPIGDRKKQLLAKLESRFGKKAIPTRPSKNFVRKAEPALRSKPSKKLMPFDVKTPTLALSFRVPELTHEDIPALDLLSNILSMGEQSRLYQGLFYGRSIVTEVGGGMYVPHDPGMLYFQAEYEKLESTEEVTKALLEELVKVRDQGPTEEELKRVMVNAESERVYATQTVDGLAGRIGFLNFVVGDATFDERYLNRLRAVTLEDLKRVAKTYLDPERLAILIQYPKEQTAKGLDVVVEKLCLEHLARAKTKTEVKVKSEKRAALPELIELPSGVRVFYRERKASGVMSVHAATLGGLRLELSEFGPQAASTHWGLSNLMAQTWTKGTRNRSANEVSKIVEGSAAGMDGYSGRNTVGVQLTGLSRDWAQLSSLFNEVLWTPTFPESELELSKKVTEDSIKSVENHSSQLCSQLFLEQMFTTHPYGKTTLGSLESLAKINSATLQEAHRRWLVPRRMVVSVVGSVTRPQLDAFCVELEKFAQAALLASPEHARAPEKVVLPSEPALAAPRWVERKFNREQVHILMGTLGTTLDSKDRPALALMQTLLGGQSGRLFIELREKKSLAYTVAPIIFEGVESGYCAVYIACSPGKREEAIQGIMKVLGDLAAKPPGAVELKRAQEYYLGRRAMDLQGDSSIASHYSLEAVYRLPLRSEEEVARQIRAVTAKQIQEACARYFLSTPMVTSVVG